MSPTLQIGDNEVERTDISARRTGVGVGLAYYLMPANVYVSATVAGTALDIEEQLEGASSLVVHTSFDPSLSLMVGKEWWVSRDWGVGIAAEVFVGTASQNHYGSGSWRATAFAIGVTASYN